MVKSYQTKSRKELLAYCERMGNRRFCAKDIFDYLKEQNISMNSATVYRNLDKLVSDKILLRTKSSQEDSCYYQYAGENSHCHEHLHLQCKKCGRIIHFEDSVMDKLNSFIQKELKMALIPSESLLIGLCDECRKTAGDFKFVLR